jgi:hypothetical protein
VEFFRHTIWVDFCAAGFAHSAVLTRSRASVTAAFTGQVTFCVLHTITSVGDILSFVPSLTHNISLIALCTVCVYVCMCEFMAVCMYAFVKLESIICI